MSNTELRAREGIPDYLDPVMVFDDAASGRRVLWAAWEGDDWIFWRHPDGQWVSWRRLTSRDREILERTRSNDYGRIAAQAMRDGDPATAEELMQRAIRSCERVEGGTDG